MPSQRLPAISWKLEPLCSTCKHGLRGPQKDRVFPYALRLATLTWQARVAGSVGYRSVCLQYQEMNGNYVNSLTVFSK